jgi:predicted nucleotidyltransferase
MNHFPPELRDAVRNLARSHGARSIRLFGSHARGQAQSGSDVDFLVEMEDHTSLLDQIALKQDLESLLGCPVDVVTQQALHPGIRAHVLKEATRL